MGATETKTAREVVTEYFDALNEHDLDRATATWKPGSLDRIDGFDDLVAPDGIRDYFGNFFAAVPDFHFEELSYIAEGDAVAVHWHMRGTFSGTAKFQGFTPNGKELEMHGTDVFQVEDGKIISNHAYTNGLVFARQIGAFPPAGSAGERAMATMFNVKTALAKRLGRG